MGRKLVTEPTTVQAWRAEIRDEDGSVTDAIHLSMADNGHHG